MFFTDNLYQYHLKSDGTIGIIRYVGKYKKIINIPTTKNGKLITSINTSDFEDIKTNKIIIPEGIKRIEQSAFYNCSLEEIILPKTLIYIGVSVFENCNKLKNIKIPDLITTIYPRSFAYCSNLNERLCHL